jgi:hypothetical protein
LVFPGSPEHQGTPGVFGSAVTLDYDKEEMLWYDCTLPLRPKGGLSSSDFDAMEDAFHIQYDDELL